MRRIFILFTAIFLLLLDQTVLPFFSVFNTYGSILFSFFGLFAMMTDYEDAFMLALISGVLQDVFFPYVFGLNILTNLFLYMGLSRVGLSLKEGRKTIPVLFVALAQAIKTLVIFFVLFMIGVRGNYLSIVVIPFYTMIIGIIIYRIVVAYSRIPLVKKEWRF